MKIHHFNHLAKAAQQQTLLNNGTFLYERVEGPFKIMLYQLDEFYVEVFFSNINNKPSWFKAFNDTEELQPYLETIDVSGLVKETSYWLLQN